MEWRRKVSVQARDISFGWISDRLFQKFLTLRTRAIYSIIFFSVWSELTNTTSNGLLSAFNSETNSVSLAVNLNGN